MEQKNNKTYEIEKSPLYKLRSRKKLLEIFYIPDYKKLQLLSFNTNNYKVYNANNKNKTTKRKIEEPKELLKKFHRRFNSLLQRIETPDFVKAGKKGSCYVNNGESHVNSKYFYCTDIKKFFPNTKKEKVFQFLLYNLKMENDIARLLTDVLTFEGHLPTGSPSSQLLTYWAYKKTFEDIYEKATALGITMTLFVDDLTFSSKTKIPKEFKIYVKSRIESEGLQINKKKTKNYGANQYKKTTGTIITPDNKLEVPNKLQQKIYDLKHKENKTKKEFERLRGMITSARQIKPYFMDSYYKELIMCNF